MTYGLSLQKGAIVLIPITKCLFKFVLTVHIFIRGKKCALVLLKSSIFCHGKVMLFKTGKGNCAGLLYSISGAMLTTPVGATRQF